MDDLTLIIAAIVFGFLIYGSYTKPKPEDDAEKEGAEGKEKK